MRFFTRSRVDGEDGGDCGSCDDGSCGDSSHDQSAPDYDGDDDE